MNLTETLKAREKSYGEFRINAAVSQQLKTVMRSAPQWANLEPFQREALEQIASKLGRLLSADHRHRDTWHDLAGYSTLVAERVGLAPAGVVPEIDLTVCRDTAER